MKRTVLALALAVLVLPLAFLLGRATAPVVYETTGRLPASSIYAARITRYGSDLTELYLTEDALSWSTAINILNLSKVEGAPPSDTCLYWIEFSDSYPPTDGREPMTPGGFGITHTVRIGEVSLWVDGVVYTPNFDMELLLDDLYDAFDRGCETYGGHLIVTPAD